VDRLKCGFPTLRTLSRQFWLVLLNLLIQLSKNYFDDMGHPERGNYVINCPIKHWSIFGFLDDTHIRKCQPGSGPSVGLEMVLDV
jgi:hypothetical protein